MFAPSIKRSPRFFVELALSDPARSMSDSLPVFTCEILPSARSLCSTRICSTAWDREDSLFAAVGSCVRLRLPRCSRFITSSTDTVSISDMPATQGP